MYCKYIYIYTHMIIYPRKNAGKVNFRTLSVAFYIFVGVGANPYGDGSKPLAIFWG